MVSSQIDTTRLERLVWFFDQLDTLRNERRKVNQARIREFLETVRMPASM